MPPPTPDVGFDIPTLPVLTYRLPCQLACLLGQVEQLELVTKDSKTFVGPRGEILPGGTADWLANGDKKIICPEGYAGRSHY